MSSVPNVVFVLIGALVFLALGFELYKYIKAHPQALADLTARFKVLETKVQATASSDMALLHVRLDNLKTQLGMVHQAALAPVTVTVVPATPPADPPPLTAQEAQNLAIYGNKDGPAPGQAGSPAPAPTPPPVAKTNAPWPAGSYFQVDILNGQSARSDPFTLPIGTYVVGATDGFAYGWCTASIDGVGPVVGGGTFKVAAELATVMTATATPGNPSSTSTRFGAQLYKTA